MSDNTQKTLELVRKKYGEIALGGAASCCQGQGCCSANSDASAKLAQGIGYSAEDLSNLPAGANMGLSCGNPLAIASLKDGEHILDLGSGGGFDAFQAGRMVGSTGRVIGVDMTPEMLAKARKNTAMYQQNTGLDNVEFRLGEIENLPLADNSIDVVISNCVLNLSPNKPRVWREVYRVLKKDGRVAVSDMALLKPLPESIAEMALALVGCISGASLIQDIQNTLQQQGFKEISLEPKQGYVDQMRQNSGSFYHELIGNLPDGAKLEDYIVSLDISAKK